MGAEHAKQLILQGAKVFGFDISPDESGQLADQLGEKRFFFRVGDVTREEDWMQVVEECTHRFGPPNVLVNNAGIFRSNRAESTSLDEYRSVVEVNQIGTYLGMKSVIPSMRKSQKGSIINISSTAGLVGFEDNFAYAASKWAVRGMTKVAALELAEDNIRVNSVCPGETATPLIMDSPEAGTAMPPTAIPFKRWADPHEISSAIIFLASDESSYMSGSDLVIDGAYTAG